MAELRKYRRREQTQVIAVRLDLETDGFTYRKWGALQTCKAGDWLAFNGEDTYTIDSAAFARTYAPLRPGVYEKVATIYAEEASEAGALSTYEGTTHYEAGDFLVFENADREGGYAISRDRFAELYTLDDE